MKAPKCPRCGGFAVAVETVYGIRHSCCDLWSWGGKPLADEETHRARQAAHAAFDPIWKTGMMPRAEAYRRLAAAMGIPPEKCHMAQMDKTTARRVPQVVARLASSADNFPVIE